MKLRFPFQPGWGRNVTFLVADYQYANAASSHDGDERKLLKGGNWA
jgi:hypothetical protein